MAEASPALIRKESELSVRRQCELVGLTRSTLYYEAVRPDEAALERKEAVMAEIDYWHTMLPSMGMRKMVVKLEQRGYRVSRKTVRKYMEEMGIHTVYPKANLSKRNFKEAIVPYLLRTVNVQFPNQVWSIDITYIKMVHGHMYLTAVIDWYSRKIVGWKLSDTLSTQPVVEAVKEAVENCGTPAILNSDQGSQFTSEEYKRLLGDLHIRQSMDGKSRWADNVMIERWFRSLKTELIYINEFHSPRHLRTQIGEYVHLYNRPVRKPIKWRAESYKFRRAGKREGQIFSSYFCSVQRECENA